MTRTIFHTLKAVGAVVAAAVACSLLVAPSASADTPSWDPHNKITTTGNGPRSVAWSPDGTMLATGDHDGNTVSVFTVDATGQPGNRKFAATGTGPFSVAWSPDGTKLATADYANNAMSVFDVDATGQLSGRKSAPTGEMPIALTWSPDGTRVATADGGSNSALSVLPLDGAGQPGSRMTVAMGTRPFWVAWSPDGTKLATADMGSNTVSVLQASPPPPLTATAMANSLEVTVDSLITLTMTDSDVALSGVTGATGAATPDPTMAYTVATNNATGYAVAIRADQADLVGSLPGNTDTLPVSAITATAAGTSGTSSGATSLLTSDAPIYSTTARTAAAGDAPTTDFAADLPFVNADEYTGTVTFTATANS